MTNGAPATPATPADLATAGAAAVDAIVLSAVKSSLELLDIEAAVKEKPTAAGPEANLADLATASSAAVDAIVLSAVKSSLELLDIEAAVKLEPTAALPEGFVREVLANVRAAMRQTRVSAFLSFVVGVALVVSYNFGGERVRSGFDRLEELQAAGGVPLSMLTTCISGGLLPSLFQMARGHSPEPRLLHLVFQLALWAVAGGAADRLYFMQAQVFGDGTDAVTVVKKVLADQFIWNPLVNVPFLATVYRWRDHGFTHRCKVVFQARPWGLTYCSVLLTIWMTWFPGTSVVYLFPSALQMPAFNVINFMFAILLGFVSQNSTRSSERVSES